MILAFEDDEKFKEALDDLFRSSQRVFELSLTDRQLGLVDGLYSKWRQRNRLGYFYRTIPDTEISTAMTGVRRGRYAA